MKSAGTESAIRLAPMLAGAGGDGPPSTPSGLFRAPTPSAAKPLTAADNAPALSPLPAPGRPIPSFRRFVRAVKAGLLPRRHFLPFNLRPAWPP